MNLNSKAFGMIVLLLSLEIIFKFRSTNKIWEKRALKRCLGCCRWFCTLTSAWLFPILPDKSDAFVLPARCLHLSALLQTIATRRRIGDNRNLMCCKGSDRTIFNRDELYYNFVHISEYKYPLRTIWDGWC
jgi:hypothetical protein